MKLVEKLNEISEILKRLDFIEVSAILTDKPIIEKELVKIETELDFEFPKELRRIYINETSRINFSWRVNNKVFGENCKNGEFHLLSPRNILENYLEMKYEVEQIIEINDLEMDDGLKAIVEDWGNWIPITRFKNGDGFCIDKRNYNIVFLEHDVLDSGPNLHGMILGKSFTDLLEKWAKVAFVDIYDWTLVCDDDGIDINSSAFNEIKAKIKFQL